MADGLVPVAALAPRLVAGTPLLAVRVPALERTAWREGLRRARGLERRVAVAFAAAAARALRAGDVVAHDRGSDVFLAALLAPTRDGDAAPAPVDVRSALARIATSVEGAARVAIESGWTARDGTSALAADVERALVRGARERERYAFFSAVGHELRTPLSSIRGYLETLLESEVDAATRRRFLGVAHAEALRLGRLVDAMFEMSLLDLHATFPHRGAAALAPAFDAAVAACAAAAAAREVRIETAPDEAQAAIDPDRLVLVLVNLVDNAIKHGRARGRVALAADASDPRTLRITVDDDGPGVAPEDRERVFGFGARGTTLGPGSGIGLALARLIAERVGGALGLESSPLGGARFVLALPRRASSA